MMQARSNFQIWFQKKNSNLVSVSIVQSVRKPLMPMLETIEETGGNDNSVVLDRRNSQKIGNY